MRELQLSWQVAYSYFMCYLNEIDSDTTGQLNFANVYERGKSDTLLSKAKVDAAAFFRTRGGTPRLGGAVEWTGNFNAGSKKCCIAYNTGTDHTAAQLDDAGNCRFKHACMQWVSDKGPAGQCLATTQSPPALRSHKKLSQPPGEPRCALPVAEGGRV